MKGFLIFCTIMPSLVSNAQDSTKQGNLILSGSVDAYYRYNFQNAKDSMRTNNYTSYTNSQNSFELGMASFRADYSKGKTGSVLDIGFGRRAEESSYNDGDKDQAKNGFISLANIKQAFVSYAPLDKVKFTMGKWFRHVGYEVADAYLNRNYSMDYMFSYGPFFHTGIKADITANKNFAFMFGIANPTDMSTASFSPKHFLAQIHLTSNDAKANGYINYLGGENVSKKTTNEIDLVFSDLLSDKFSIGYNGAMRIVKPNTGGSNSWWGSALYLNFDPTTVLGLTVRAEYFNDEDSLAGFGTGIFDYTISANIHIDNLTIIPEIRVDTAKDPLFYKNSDGNTPSAKSTQSFILAAVYHF